MRTFIRGVGQLLITLGIVILLFIVYELWWTNFATERAQHKLLIKFEHNSNEAHPPPISTIPIGQGIAVLYIPRFGKSYHEVIVQGTGEAQLAEGPGHFVSPDPSAYHVAYPGQVGNFYVAGHRTTHTAPFNRLAELRDGDDIYVETTTAWYVYQLSNITIAPGHVVKFSEIVSPNDLSISYPVPDQPNASLKATQRLLTFSTCNPEYSATSRLVVHGILIEHYLRKTNPARPPAIVNGLKTLPVNG